MRLSVLFSDALNAIKRNKKRSILTMLGIIIGIGAVIAIISIGRGFENYVVESLTEDNSNEITSTINFQPNDTSLLYDNNIEFFKQKEIMELKNIPGVTDVKLENGQDSTGQVTLSITGDKDTENIVGKLEENTNMDLLEGRNLTSVDNSKENRVIVISDSTAKKLFQKKGSYVGRSLEIKGLNYEIVGVTKGASGMMELMEYAIYIPENTYNFYNKATGSSSRLTLYLKPGSSVNDISENVVDYLSTNGSMKNLGKYMYMDLGEIMDGISNILDSVTLFIALIGGISLFIAGIGMMNMMFISVSERTKEIGIRRALGATKKNITVQFLLEGITITIIGGVLGYFFGLILAMVISLVLPFSVSIEAGPVMVALLISLLIGIVFSYSPAKAAANKNVIEILA